MVCVVRFRPGTAAVVCVVIFVIEIAISLGMRVGDTHTHTHTTAFRMLGHKSTFWYQPTEGLYCEDRITDSGVSAT